jgi:hypothetical protein
MLEKYYHSRGAAAYDEGRFDQAIRFFRKALVLDNQAYTRSHLSLAYEGKNDPKRALEQITKAIGLAPSNPEYYLRRSVMWRREDDEKRAKEDYAAAIRIDANYARLEEIRAAVHAVEQAFSHSERDELPETSAVRDKQLRGILERVTALGEQRRRAVENRSCIVACPAFCCHFTKELALHGVIVGPWKLRAVRDLITQRGLKEEEFLEKTSISEEELRLRLIPPDVVMKAQGQQVIFYPKRTGTRLGPDLMQNLPSGRGYDRIGWITEEARTCAFLADGRCSIHDLAGEAALPACKEFICLTGFVFLVLVHLGIMNEEELREFDMKESNRLALEAVLLLAKHMYGNERTVKLESDLRNIIRQAIDADRMEDTGKGVELINRYRLLEGRYTSRLSGQLELLRRDIRRLSKGGEPETTKRGRK